MVDVQRSEVRCQHCHHGGLPAEHQEHSRGRPCICTCLVKCGQPGCIAPIPEEAEDARALMRHVEMLRAFGLPRQPWEGMGQG